MAIQQQNVERIKRLLIERRTALEQRRQRVERDLGHSNDPLVSDFSDQAVQRQNDETLEAIGTAAENEVTAIGEAIRRIDQGLYGICTVCGKPIETVRLQAVPHAIACVDCAGA